MDKHNLCEAMYALQSGAVVRRKKSLLPTVAVLMIGLLLVVLYSMIEEQLSKNLSSSLMLATGVVVMVGLLMLATRLSDREGCPALAATGERLRYAEYYFPIERRKEVQRYIDEGALMRLMAATENQNSGIGVAIYHSTDRTFAAMQAYEYIGFEYRPITGIKIVEG